MRTLLGILAVAALGLASSPAWAHDASCLVVYEDITGSVAFAPFLPAGYELLDDVHTSVAGSVVLCAVDVRGRPTSAGTLLVSVYANDGDGNPPGALLAGPVSMTFTAGTTTNAVFHFEFPMTAVGQDLWIGQRWDGDAGGWVPTPRPTPTIGTSHDTWYYRTPTGDFFDNSGDGEASLYLVAYGSAPVPANTSSWGEVKAMYR